jgi:hypothetical protein
MDWLYVLLLVLGFIFALFLLYYLIKKNMKYFIPSYIFLLFGLVMILLSETVETGGGFLDIIYMLFGILSIFISIIVGLVILVVRATKKNRK